MGWPLLSEPSVGCVGCRRSPVSSGRLRGGVGIWVVDESLHGRLRERERRGQGQAFVVHVVYGNRTGGAAEASLGGGLEGAVAQRAAASRNQKLN